MNRQTGGACLSYSRYLQSSYAILDIFNLNITTNSKEVEPLPIAISSAVGLLSIPSYLFSALPCASDQVRKDA